MIRWEPKYVIGNAEIDRQHEHILDLANTIRLAITSGESDATLDILIDHLVRFMRLHFRAEERLMIIVGFPGVARHAAEHEHCGTIVEEFLQQVRGGKVDRARLADFIEDWVVTHLAKADRGLIPYIEQAHDAARLWAESVRKEMPAKPILH